MDIDTPVVLAAKAKPMDAPYRLDEKFDPGSDHDTLTKVFAALSDQRKAELRKNYLGYFRENQCLPNGDAGWDKLGGYFLQLAMKGSHNLVLSRQDFEADTQGMFSHIPDWVRQVHFVQMEELYPTDPNDPKGIYYVSLPPKVLAQQAYFHARNPKSEDDDYMPPPIAELVDVIKEPRSVTILNTRICDYVISHCA
ncbi:MAG: hypothetical protein J0H01_06500 [Rhizobiales bacterium]|nr:hypothetical protein [Hyphomicrobiales bacterium]